MLSLAYFGALRRAELVALRIEDLDVAHRLISVRAETTKGKRSRVVCYSPDIAPVLIEHLHLFAALAGCEVRCFDQHQIVIEARHCPVGRGVKRLKGGPRKRNYRT
ncbi:tyrosine-type recombinase/integrase [Pseudomonas aeruginosa]|nr:tyrosine-type recombinase/integrase [Pseudomonas aeruginosa]